MVNLKVYTQDPSKHQVTLVQEDGKELNGTVFQKIWDDEQKRQRDDALNGSSDSLYMVQVLSSTTIGYDKLLLEINFVDPCCRYIYQSRSGVGSWYFITHPTDSQDAPDSQEPTKKKTYKHEFFHNELAPVATWIYQGIVALLQARFEMSAIPKRMVCECAFDVNRSDHPTYMISVYVTLPDSTEIKPKYAFTEHLICTNAKLTKVFHVLCNPPPVKEFLQDAWSDPEVTRELSIQCDTIGWGADNVVDYKTAVKSKMLVGSFAWPAGVLGAIIFPKPAGVTEIPFGGNH